MSGFLPIPPWFAPDVKERCREFDAWDSELRRRRPLAGLSLRFNRLGVNLSRHWPHLLCWQWIARIGPSTGYRWRRWFGFYRSGPGTVGGFHIVVTLFGLSFSYQRQASDRIAQFGAHRRAAPVIHRHRPANDEAA